MRSNFSDKLKGPFFSEGWVSFFPLFGLYLVLWFFHAPLASWNGLFTAIHAVAFATIALAWGLKAPNLPREEKIFAALILLVCFLPGAYLEYPSDPWEHVRRIFLWQNIPVISEYGLIKKFGYFWDWTLIRDVPILLRYRAFDFLNGFWLCVLCYQVYLFVQALGVSPRWAKWHVGGFLFLFGTNLYNFRYYTLSSTPLAYAAYLAAARAFLLNFRTKRRALWVLAPLGLLIYFNHFQELVFLALLATVATGVWAYEKLTSARQRLVKKGLATILGLGFAFGYAAKHLRPGWYRLTDAKTMTAFGSFRLWSPDTSYFETLGLTGGVALLLCALTFKRRRLINALTLAPAAAMVYPPTAFLLLRFCNDAYDPYRLLYAFPVFIGLFSAIESLEKSDRFKLITATVTLFLFSTVSARAPLRGKAYFHFAQPPVERTLEPLLATADWFAKNRRLPVKCWLISDDATVIFLQAHLGREQQGNGHRADPNLYAKQIIFENEFKQMAKLRPFCGFLIPRLDDIPPTPPSKVASLSRHWDQKLGDRHWLISAEFVEKGNRFLSKWGWNKTFVPPYYDLYEPPHGGK